jgi:hypothetical protein
MNGLSREGEMEGHEFPSVAPLDAQLTELI